jgi:hypothetical protein
MTDIQYGVCHIGSGYCNIGGDSGKLTSCARGIGEFGRKNNNLMMNTEDRGDNA